MMIPQAKPESTASHSTLKGPSLPPSRQESSDYDWFTSFIQRKGAMTPLESSPLSDYDCVLLSSPSSARSHISVRTPSPSAESQRPIDRSTTIYQPLTAIRPSSGHGSSDSNPESLLEDVERGRRLHGQPVTSRMRSPVPIVLPSPEHTWSPVLIRPPSYTSLDNRLTGLTATTDQRGASPISRLSTPQSLYESRPSTAMQELPPPNEERTNEASIHSSSVHSSRLPTSILAVRSPSPVYTRSSSGSARSQSPPPVIPVLSNIPSTRTCSPSSIRAWSQPPFGNNVPRPFVYTPIPPSPSQSFMRYHSPRIAPFSNLPAVFTPSSAPELTPRLLGEPSRVIPPLCSGVPSLVSRMHDGTGVGTTKNDHTDSDPNFIPWVPPTPPPITPSVTSTILHRPHDHTWTGANWGPGQKGRFDPNHNSPWVPLRPPIAQTQGVVNASSSPNLHHQSSQFPQVTPYGSWNSPLQPFIPPVIPPPPPDTPKVNDSRWACGPRGGVGDSSVGGVFGVGGYSGFGNGPSGAVWPVPPSFPAPTHPFPSTFHTIPSVPPSLPGFSHVSPSFPPGFIPTSQVSRIPDQPAAPNVVPLSPKYHHRYYFYDGSVLILVHNTLYKIHQCFFRHFTQLQLFHHSMQQGYTRSVDPRFESVFSIADVQGSQTIQLRGIECRQFDIVLSLFYPIDLLEPQPKTFADWSDILHVAHTIDIPPVRTLAISKISQLGPKVVPPVDKIVLADKYGIKEWFLPAYMELVGRMEDLSVEECEKLPSGGALLVDTLKDEVKEQIRMLVEEDSMYLPM
ncbi:uncharacterized protein C8R40DRAFT_1267135 [Lentinula edodes]|uniref:uncharacterized protein n=1 Tax=Lentinula edodes TaxID=5353 RepID=UPI001E8DEE87|nr:uncharacterized protein C8R40DRAFT_1267135 [Lentinula edodes]KAH7871990.1 hypothetical protein C8R40DRAFT_1267135 [Lentinula edodes]